MSESLGPDANLSEKISYSRDPNVPVSVSPPSNRKYMQIPVMTRRGIVMCDVDSAGCAKLPSWVEEQNDSNNEYTVVASIYLVKLIQERDKAVQEIKKLIQERDNAERKVKKWEINEEEHRSRLMQQGLFISPNFNIERHTT